MNRNLRLEADESRRSNNASSAQPAPPREVEEGAMAPSWSGDALLLTRRVSVNGARYAQACWLDWPVLRRDLLATIADLLPNAQLQPLADAPSGDDERRLATLPVRLLPGSLPRRRQHVRWSSSRWRERGPAWSPPWPWPCCCAP